MQQTPPRPRLFTDTAIARKIFLEYNENGIDIVRDLTGTALDDSAVDTLNNPAISARIVIRLSPDDPANAPLVFRYFIQKFHIDHDQYERVLEIRLEPWPNPQSPDRNRSTPPVKVFSQGATTIFAQTIVKVVTIRDDKKGFYEIRSNAKLDQLTGIITL